MTPEQITLVKSSWAKVVPIADQAADIFYGRLFEVAPSVRPLFKDDMTAQKKALMGILATAVNGLDDLEAIVPAVQAMGARHATYGAEPAHYDVVGECLIYTLEQGLGDSFTPEIKSAWVMTYTTLADVMKAGADS